MAKTSEVTLNQDITYLNIWDYKNNQYPFNIFIGGRGYGKTYSALRGVSVGGELAKGRKFILMRRTQTELDLLCDSNQGEGANPLKPINEDFHVNYGFTGIVQNLKGCYAREVNENGNFDYIGSPIGYGVALSTIAKIRGLSFEDCDVLIYDEFIKEKHVNKMRGEFDALMNAVETINRNRELKGGKPIQVYLLANSNDIYNDIFVGLGIVTDIERMIRQGKEHKYYPQRGLAVHVMSDSSIFTEQKSKTALYKLTAGTQFADMSLHNEFSFNDFSDIKHLELKGFEPICGLGKAWIYKKKGQTLFYVCYASAHVPHYSYPNEIDKRAFNRVIGMKLYDLSMVHAIAYESYELKSIILDTIGLLE